MIEEVFTLAKGNEKTIEKVVFDENVHYAHMILAKGDFVPEHYSNSTVYMTIIRGRLSIALNDEKAHFYEAGTLLKIPFNTKMNISNDAESALEIIVVKAPAPK
ncbi:MAG TPA: cupin domain-containing protein [Spirochaetota bacterium]|nr:cupin domain-containing protein [Spirochaetota bacterium]HOR45919.1 cupin domain-containing protein [Spirochaetota bacterium]HPK57641.1 cupin domain-containing protein [Spirochaetota bacterium]